MPPVYRILTILFVFFLSILPPLTANAHKLRIFAWPEGDIIHGQTAFNGNSKPKNVEITVQNAASHAILFTTQTDEQGKFNFKLPEKAVREQVDLLLVVKSDEGHRGEWSLPAAEYLALASQPLNEESHTSAPDVTAPYPSAPAVRTTSNYIDEQMLRQIVGEEMEKQLAPLKYMIAEDSNNKPDLRDILGGIGYILGLGGILAWVQAKNSDKGRKDDV